MMQICNFLDSCKTKYLWTRVRDAVAHTLDSITLAELVAVAEDQPTSTHFIALSDIHLGTTPKVGPLDTQPAALPGSTPAS